MIIVSYGTLKKGFYNHKRCGMDQQEYLGEITIPNYKMYNLGFYPTVVKSNDPKDTIFVEIYDVGDDVFEFINRMELNTGYHVEEVEVEIDGKVIKALIFAMVNEQVDGKYELIKDGIYKM